MDISITVDSDQGEADLRSLQQWLLQEPGLRQARFTRPAPVTRPGEMGAGSEILLASLGAGGAGAVMANSVSVWLQSRVTQVKVRIEGPHGSVEVEAGNVRDPAALITRVLEERPDPDSGSSLDRGREDGGSPPDGAS
ncbi:effector-associated constant component EACC1 [Streptomyces sp. CA-135486]|uniref:effector-associated constant component EACC1 n=1 Tax=Streptomyces sp. CA-135486 TaxID=3240049 RepID=UPI003D8A542B